MTTPEPRNDPGGRLLISTPMLRDGVFNNTVVYLLAHSIEGSLGVVLNQPSDEPVGTTMSDWSALASPPRDLFVGGPVAEDTLIGVSVTTVGGEGFARVPGPLDCHTMDLEVDSALAATHVTNLRIFAGYAGWGPGQVQSEIDAGGWFVAEAYLGDVFSPEPEALWEQVLSRQADSRRWYLNYPDNPNHN